MARIKHGLGQALVWLAFAGVVGAFAQGPAFSPVPPGHGELKFSMAHLTDRLEPCRRLTQAERQKLPPTRRVKEKCGRARAEAMVEISLDGERLLRRTAEPAGLHEGGRVFMLEFWTLPAGRHELTLAMRDTPGADDFDEKHSFDLNLQDGDSALLNVGDGDVQLRQPSREEK